MVLSKCQGGGMAVLWCVRKGDVSMWRGFYVEGFLFGRVSNWSAAPHRESSVSFSRHDSIVSPLFHLVDMQIA